eukprot:TRINITY_DN476_c0_g1_i11.p1 TRINITY_DN476_c0_g1~~TRINITY_DN476_c0_g1_i11.p1  ORF type:complete len:1230 (-),score=306.52 TRINITY_DN476_c0_g1_i11:343-4032(-)
MKFYIFLGLLTACLAQEGSNSRQNKAWKFTDESNKSPSPEESVREERTIDILQPSKDEREREPKILDAGTSATTNRSAEQVEGRFFLKDKLCLLGLADCNPKRAYQGGGGALNLGGIQYVQPIKVVPHGAPIAAVPIANPHQQTGYQAPKPSYGVPKPTYNAPKPSYDAPKPVYNAPKPSYGAPKPVYNAPKPSYGAPKPSYGAPQPSYGAPKPSYGAPKPSYGAPSNTYGAPSSSNLGYQSSSLDTYGVDRYQGQLTGNIYSHPYQTNFGSVALKRDDDGSHNHGGHHHGSGNSHHGSGNSHHGSGNSHHGSGNSHHGSTNIHHGAGNSHHGAGNSHHGSGSSHQGSGSSHHGLGNSHQGSVNTQFTSQTFQNSPQQSSFHVSSPSPPRRGNRQGRLEDDCYCVPISQCPSFTTTGPVFTTGSNAKQLPNSQRKDYSHLINPRNKVTSIEAEEDEDEKVESVDPTKPEAKESNEKDEPKKREVRTGKALETPKKEESQVEVKSPESRKKRDVEEPQDFTDPNFNAGEVLSPRLTNTFVDGEVTSISEEEEVEEEKEEEEEDSLTRTDEIILDEDKKDESTSDAEKRHSVSSDKQAKINLEEVQEDVTNKLSEVGDTVSVVGNQVSTGVNDIIRNIGSALGFGENFQPTVGVSFGLPNQPNNLYAGQAQNPLGTGSAVNPFYTGPNGLPVGALDVSPLVSFQATTNDQGEIVSKPLINLHLTPNGCGLFGCDSAEDYTQKSSLYNQYLASSSSSYYKSQSPAVAKRKYGPEPNPASSSEPSYPTVNHEHHHYHHGLNSIKDYYVPTNGYDGRTSSSGSSERISGFRFPEGRSLERKKRDVQEIERVNPFLRKKPKKISQNTQQQLVSESNVAEVRQRAPFGPNGIKPPTCGYPNSGYVCCSISSGRPTVTQFTGGSSEFQQFTTQKNNRAVNSGGRFTTFNSNVNNNNNNNNIKLTSTSTPGQCGQRNSQGINGRITGTLFERKNGETEFGEYPWQVAILKKDTLDNVYLCAGSLIDGSHVITAAHCVRGYNPDELVLRLGEWDVNNDSEFYTHIEIDAKHIFVHEKFYPGNLYNDIAVIRLNKYVDFSRNRHISPVCLPDTFHSFAGQRCYVTGWGKDAFLEGNYQHILKEVNVPVLDNGRCERLLRQSKLGPDFVLDKGFLCAGGEEGKDACKGDGGGPLVCEVNGLWQLAGIVSWGIGCGEYNVPGVYVKVSEYEEWIQRQLLRAF